jgi:uncharacterized membrane protein (UPF0136 family)
MLQGLRPAFPSKPRVVPGRSLGSNHALATKLFTKNSHPYGIIWRNVRTSDLLTSVNFFSLRMRPGFFVPSK